MDKKKRGLLGGTILILALITVVGIVYAAYSQTLNIDGTATVKSAKWEIKFANLSNVQLTGKASEVTAPSIKSNETTIGDYSVLISEPGDSVTYTFNIVNNGTFDATASIASITGLNPKCTGTGNNAEDDAANVCKYLTYSWKFPDDSIAADEDTINLGAGKTLTGVSLTLKYADSIPSEELPVNDVAISELDTSIVFTQAD